MIVPNLCSKYFFRIDRREIHFLKFVLEGYGGLAVMRTVNSSEGLVVLHVSPGCEGEVNAILADVGKQIRIEAVSAEKQEVR